MAQWGTHAVRMSADRVVKRFVTKDGRDRAEREWRALGLLAEHAPGLAPRPLEAALDADPPGVAMSRLNGVPLRGRAMGTAEVRALADAVTALHTAVPQPVLRALPLRPGHQAALVALVEAWAVRERPRFGGAPARAVDAGLAWLERSGLRGSAGGEGASPVFGPGDGNLANYVWDGSRVRVVDFEESGRSDRAFELAEIIEHVGSWLEQPLDVAAFLGNFDLPRGESERLGDCRRLLALVWLFLLAMDDPEHPRNPPGTADRQADRLLALL